MRNCGGLAGQLRITLPDSDAIAGHLCTGWKGPPSSSYARMLMEAALERGWRSCVLHFQRLRRLSKPLCHAATMPVKPMTCATFLNELRRSNAQESGNAGPDRRRRAYSLGGNVLLKYLGESRDRRNTDQGRRNRRLRSPEFARMFSRIK